MPDEEAIINELADSMRASYGVEALRVIAARIEQCQLADDLEGLRIWCEVEAKLAA